MPDPVLWNCIVFSSSSELFVPESYAGTFVQELQKIHNNYM